MKNLSVMIKPASGNCNMRCTYCFYNDVSDNRQTKSYGIMSGETLEKLIENVCNCVENNCSLAFQGGEPTLAGLDYFVNLIELEKKYNQQHIQFNHAIQTNGLLIHNDWAKYLKENHFLVGLSVDGNNSIHDSMRTDANRKGTYSRVQKTARLLSECGVPFNVLTVVTRQSARHIDQIYHSFLKNGWNYMQFIPCLDPYFHTRGKERYSLLPEDYTVFLKKLFDLWYADIMSGKYVYIRFFENIVGIAMNIAPESCGMLGHCTQQFVVEADGGVYPCDFYVMDDYYTGSVLRDSFEELAQKGKTFIEQSISVMEECRSCDCFAFCRGGCRRDRDTEGVIGKNYYCSSYREFYEYIWSRLPSLAAMYKTGLGKEKTKR